MTISRSQSPASTPGLTHRSPWPLLLAAGASLIAYGGMAVLHWQTGTLRQAATPDTLGWYTVAFLAYLGAVWGLRRRSTPLSLIFAGAIAFRLLLLLTTPTLSDDIYRYLWDGYVANHGISPYAYPIDSPELDHLDTPQRALANNRWMASPYLPAAQYLFVGLTRLSPASPRLFQAAMLLIDIMNGLLLVQLLRVVHLPTDRVLLYLWNPLIVVESSHGAHLDTWMIFLMLLTLWLTFTVQSPLGSPQREISRFSSSRQVRDLAILDRKRQSRTGFEPTKLLYRPTRVGGLAFTTLCLAPIFLALATLTKVLPIFLLAVLFWRWRWWQLGLYGLVTVGLMLPPLLTVGSGLFGPMDGTGLFGAIRIYADQWNFNSGLFYWLETTLTEQGVVEANRWAKRVVGLLLLGTLLLVWVRASRTVAVRPALRLMAIPFMAHILLATTVHPWYLMATLAFLPFLTPTSDESSRRWLLLIPWLYLSWALALSYLTYLDPHDFRELAWVRRVEWWGMWGLLLLVWLAYLKRIIFDRAA